MPITLNEFMEGYKHVPWPIRGDAYTVSSKNLVSSAAKAKSIYNFTNRRHPGYGLPDDVAKDGRMVLYGLTDFIRRELTRPVTNDDIAASQVFLYTANASGSPLDFDYKMWRRVITEYNGYLPIKIEALPEGSTFWANEPVIQVTSLGDGFGEIAAIIESVMVGYVANATARLTLTRHLLERVRETIRKYHPEYKTDDVNTLASWMIHDFGMRASSTPEESEIYGRAHLLCFNGTDTFNAAWQARMMGAEHPIGTSILALAHRIVMGYQNESEAYKAICDAVEAEDEHGMGSYVADCYEFKHAVKTFLVSIAKAGKSTVVARPDSGDFLDNIEFIVREALKHDLYKIVNRRPAATTLRFIQGDSMTWSKIQQVFERLDTLQVDPTGWGIFGVGGWLRNSVNRDTLSSAYKLAAYGHSNTPCIKISDTPAKMSVPGPTEIFRPFGGASVFLASERNCYGIVPQSAYVTYYNGGEFLYPCLEDFPTIRERVQDEFDSYANIGADRGTLANPVLSTKIRRLQEEKIRNS